MFGEEERERVCGQCRWSFPGWEAEGAKAERKAGAGWQVRGMTAGPMVGRWRGGAGCAGVTGQRQPDEGEGPLGIADGTEFLAPGEPAPSMAATAGPAQL